MKSTFRLFHCSPWTICLFSIFFINGSCLLTAQDNLSNGKALNIPFRKFGVSIGNSYEFTGIRINFADKNVIRINGVNATLWINSFRFDDSNNSLNSVVNGISVGIINAGGTMRPVNLGILGTGAGHNLSGLSIGGLFVGAGGNINGLSFSGLINETGGNINGFNISGLWTEASDISGIAVSGFALGAEAINGLAFGGVIQSGTFNGIAVAGYSWTENMNGLSVAIYNRTDELHGLQLGLLNYAGNNPKGLRMLPFVNLHLRRR